MDMPKKLEGKLAAITGATSGMALATAKLFVEEVRTSLSRVAGRNRWMPL